MSHQYQRCSPKMGSTSFARGYVGQSNGRYGKDINQGFVIQSHLLREQGLCPRHKVVKKAAAWLCKGSYCPRIEVFVTPAK